MGHSFEEIDNLSMQQRGDIISYWSGKAKAEEKLKKQRERKAKRNKGRR